MINYILIALIVLIYLINLYVLKEKQKLHYYSDIRFDDLSEIFSDLSMSMNNQVLEVMNLNKRLVKLKKYQLNENWGIKIIISLEDKNKNDAMSILNDFNIKYEVCPSQENQFDLHIDVNSNLELLMEFLKIFLSKFYKLNDDTLYTCIFTKRSVITN